MRDREREHAQENEPRSSTVQSPEQFPQDFVRARQQGWAAAPHPGGAGPSGLGRTDIGLDHWTVKEWRDVEDGELMWIEEGRRVEELELVSVEQETSLPPLWTEKPGWWLDRVPSETPTPMSLPKRVSMEGDRHETAGKGAGVETSMDDGSWGSDIQREHHEEKEEPGEREEHGWESKTTQQQQQPQPLPSSSPPTPLPSSPILPSVPPSLTSATATACYP